MLFLRRTSNHFKLSFDRAQEKNKWTENKVLDNKVVEKKVWCTWKESSIHYDKIHRRHQGGTQGTPPPPTKWKKLLKNDVISESSIFSNNFSKNR